MNIGQVNKVLSKLSEEVAKLRSETKENINIFYEDNGNFNHVIFHSIEDETGETLFQFDLYYRPSFYVNLSQEQYFDDEEIKEKIKLNDEKMTNQDIENYLNGNYNVTDWVFETCIREYENYIENFNLITFDDVDLVVNEIIEDIKNYLEV